MKKLLTLAATLAFIIPASAAMAGSYSGKWQMTVTQSQRYNGKHCLTLSDDGSFGFPHSGLATLDNLPYGTFEVIGRFIVITIDDGGTYQNAGSVYVAATRNFTLGTGAFSEDYNGESVDAGQIVFGANGSC